ncbi:MAG TPA: MBOAT family O-acyltransferase [Stellaceae bacterium]|nr:MBOAT family O-acyltransferase [Stellaceae bacterium]
MIQLGLIYLCGFGSAAGIGVILCLLLFYAFFLKRVRRLWVPALVTFFAYWIAQKYLVPFLGVPGPPFGGEQGLLVMLGISYMGFKLIHFVADQREGAIRSWSVVEFLNWMFFLPTLVAGPMQRFQDWEAQRTSPRRLEAADWVAGINQILIGLFLKLVVADTIHGATLAKMSDGVLDTADFSQLAFGAILYYIYLYCDFSGYTRIAIGIGRFWGLRIPENFNFPFLARNLAEFWNRYHITLSELLRDYLFYPLSLSLKRQPLARRFPALATVIPPLVTFILAGIWHGAGIGFALYGLVHGIGLSYLALAKRRGARTMFGKWWEGSTLGHVAGVALTFCYVSFSYIFFCLDGPRLALLAARLWP